MTSVESPLPINPDGLTALLGYEPELKMFAGFDLGRHQNFTTGSPSVQIDIRVVKAALAQGMAFDRKDNGELAVAVRPGELMGYIRNATELHESGGDASTSALLSKAAALERIRAPELAALPTERRRVVEKVSRLSRDANFRDQVLTAYGHRCAATRMQMRLVQAAHVIPVAAEGSVDHVSNGLALSPTYHLAFDQGLIYLDEEYTLHLNRKRKAHLSALKLDGGIVEFEKSLGRIHLPPDRKQWPKPEFIRRANELRQAG